MISSHPEIELAGFIEQTCLKPTATEQDIRQVCWEAEQYRFSGVCVAPVYVRLAVGLLHKKKPQVVTVIGFPAGTSTSATKLYEAQEATAHGANVLEVMANLGFVKGGQYNAVYEEFGQIVEETNRPVRAILELNLLEPDEWKRVAEICLDVGVSGLKTATGWAGATRHEDVQQLRRLVRNQLGIKAAGGIRTLNQALELLAAGADRLGTSRGVEMMREQELEGQSS